MGDGSDYRRDGLDSMLEDIELELAAIKLAADRERLDHRREPVRRPDAPAPGGAPRSIDTRGIDLNRSAAVVPQTARNDATPGNAEASKATLAERLARLHAEAAE